MRILIWNLFHGRALPPAGRSLLTEFAALIASWDWDAALLQEVPPWWPPILAQAAGATQRTVLTSRNGALPLRRALASRWPDLLKSNGGGANSLLARRPIVEHRAVRLRWWPERRLGQLGRLADGVCVVNVHSSTRPALARAELAELFAVALRFAGERPLVVGGDLNLRDPRAPDVGLAHVAVRDVDHLFARGFRPGSAVEQPDRHLTLAGRRLELSDHPALIVTLDGFCFADESAAGG